MIPRELIALPAIAESVEEGLTKNPKSLPPKLFYDASGSALFERITGLPEYYPTRAELEILRGYADEIARAAGQGVTIVELGAGSATKTCLLLHAFCRQQRRVSYFPVDISPAALGEAQRRVERQCPRVDVRPLAVDFCRGLGFLGDIAGRKLVAYLGSSIGNFDPEVAVNMLDEIRKELKKGDSLLLGTDLAKDPAILVPAYNDAQGVTAEFNKNILRRINRELSADFDVNSFRHVAFWNAERSRIEMHLESTHAQVVDIHLLHLTLEIQAGERIHTENSYKFTLPMLRGMLEEAGFASKESWLDRKQWYAIHLARA